MGAASGGDEVRSDVLDLTNVSLEALRHRNVPPVLSQLLQRRFLSAAADISAFQSYIGEDPEPTSPAEGPLHQLK